MIGKLIMWLAASALGALFFEMYVDDSTSLAIGVVMTGILFGGLWLYNYGQGKWWFT